MSAGKLTIREVAELSLFCALMVAGKECLRVIPNVHPVTLLLLLGLVAGAVIMSTVTRRHVQLDDGTVWVTSLKNQKAVRFNVKNKEADAGVSSSAPRFDIAQHNGDTILTETTKASTIKASTVSTGVKTDIKANTTTVVGGDTASLINEKTGNVLSLIHI